MQNSLSKNTYSTNPLYKFNQRNFNDTELGIVFDKTVEVVHTKFSTDIGTLLTGFGGAVSSGRTLLWIIFSLLGASQVRSWDISSKILGHPWKDFGASQVRFCGFAGDVLGHPRSDSHISSAVSVIFFPGNP